MPTANSDSFDEFETALLRAWEVLRSRAASPERLVHSADPFNDANSDVNENSVEKSASVTPELRRSSQAGC